MNHAEQASNKTDKLAFLADLQVGDTVEVAHRQYQHRIARVEKMTDRLVCTHGQ